MCVGVVWQEVAQVHVVVVQGILSGTLLEKMGKNIRFLCQIIKYIFEI